MRKFFYLYTIMLIAFIACTHKKSDIQSMKKTLFIHKSTVEKVTKQLTDSLGETFAFRIERGVQQVANLWYESDGANDAFVAFCKTNFVADTVKLHTLFNKLERNFEIFDGYFNNITLKLKEPLHLSGPEVEPVDILFGGYDVSAHLNEDMFANRVAFLTALNFPFYTLEEKTTLGKNWSRKEWAYARMGDMFISRVPAEVQQLVSHTLTAADTYISDYNIFMGKLLNKDGKQLFPEEMKLITHWGLRDELKSNYADSVHGLEKQRMIYDVMKRIVDQSIPQEVINSGKYTWNPTTNNVYDNGTVISAISEPDKRYEVFLSNFKARKQLDAYSPHYPTEIERAFDGTMEIQQKDVVDLFTRLLSSPEVKQVAAFIAARLGRKLAPFDIWYNGFKARGTMPEAELSAITSKKYPNPAALKADLPNMLVKLGWKPEKAQQITSLVAVDPSRGAGHAWGASMRNDKAHLRTRIGEKGMDYKGYNIAVHEFGHNVEQTISMNEVDYWILNGVPNTAFTEAAAFMFQKKDIELLGLKNSNPNEAHYNALDVFWSCYEIMGVSLVDVQVWEWLYRHPEATPAQLKDAVISIAKEVWNKYYGGILGNKDETLLGIYSHMIDYPLYLPNYPMGHLIDFQIERQVQGKNIADEMHRMYTQGRIVPQVWMQHAVGSKISIDPLLKATKEALSALK